MKRLGKRRAFFYRESMSCDPSELLGVGIFELLDENERAEFAAVLDSASVPAGDVIFRAGDLGDALYIVRSGEVELSVKDMTGQKIVLTVAGKNDIFGELSMLDARPRSATAAALEDTELLLLDRDDLLMLFQKQPDAALNMLAAMSGMLRKVDRLLQTRVSRNVNEEMEERLPALQRIADWIAWFSGSMLFLIINGLWFVVWIGINTLGPEPQRFDPFPFGLLTMIVSLEAIFLSCFVLISQNRQAAKDKIRADIEYDINIKAELEVAHLHEKVDHMHEQMLERFAELTPSGRKPIGSGQ
jgi:CRP/FNR family cyclic AMP-dependent transcriptional regulator